MTNDDFLQYEPMLIKISNQFKSNPFGLDIDDIRQIGSFGILKAFESYQENKGMKFSSYVFNCITWAIKREFRNLMMAKRFTNYTMISLETPVDDENSVLFLDTLEDTTQNTEEKALDIVIIKRYIDEIEMVLAHREKDIVLERLFDNKSFKEIGEIHNLDPEKARRIYEYNINFLITRSKLIQERYKYLNIRKINIFNPPDKVVIQKTVTDRVLDYIKSHLYTPENY